MIFDPDARAIPLSKQILKVFVCGLADHNGLILQVLWAKCANQSKVLSTLNVVLAGVQASECDGFCDVLGPDCSTLASALQLQEKSCLG